MKKELSFFEQMGGTYTEVDGIFYPNLVVKPEKNVVVGKYGTIWMSFMEEKYPMRYLELHMDGELRVKAAEVNEEAMEVLDTMVQAYLKKHKPMRKDTSITAICCSVIRTRESRWRRWKKEITISALTCKMKKQKRLGNIFIPKRWKKILSP